MSGQADGGVFTQIDVDQARRQIAARLEQTFGDRFSTETIDRFLDQAFDELRDHSHVDRWVPLLAERFARQQLLALSRIEGHDDSLPVVLFLDTHDAGRSQLARALFERHASGKAHAWSGGFAPSHEINPRVAATLGEFEIDLAHEYPKPVTDEIIQGADVIVVLGDIPDRIPADKRSIRWSLPALESLDGPAVDAVRDELDTRTSALADEVAAQW